jgi:hypothetical protein
MPGKVICKEGQYETPLGRLKSNICSGDLTQRWPSRQSYARQSFYRVEWLDLPQEAETEGIEMLQRLLMEQDVKAIADAFASPAAGRGIARKQETSKRRSVQLAGIEGMGFETVVHLGEEPNARVQTSERMVVRGSRIYWLIVTEIGGRSDQYSSRFFGSFRLASY